MVKFGPSGNSESFFEDGYTKTMEAPKWVKEKGLDLFEYSFGKGYVLSSETATLLGEEFKKYDIELSLHAPYFINFANPEPEMYEKTKGYIRTGIKFLHTMGAKRLVFHPGSCGKMSREDAFALTKSRFEEFMKELDDEGLLNGIYLCPETMGKQMQIGTVEEVLELCQTNNHLIPTFDFGHINARENGSLKTKKDFEKIFDLCEQKLGKERTDIAHVHFSKIEYGQKGEIRHLNFDDNLYGPNFEPLAEIIKERSLNLHIICESAGHQAEDAQFMKKMYESARQNL